MQTNLFSVKDKVIILTGGSGILGSCMAKHLAKEEAVVVILDRNEPAGNELALAINENGGKALFIYTDVLDRQLLEANAKTIRNTFGGIHVLINLAGGNMPGATIPPDKTFFDLDIEAFRKVVDLNLFGTVIPTMVFAQMMVEQRKGSIINISSESALRPLTRVIGYGTAKAAINNFTQSMAGELAIKFGEGLRVNAIAPGFFLTEQNRTLMTNPDGTPSDRCKTVIAHTPFRRLGRPDELLGTVQYLASDASAFVTGTVIPVDGGFDAFSI